MPPEVGRCLLGIPLEHHARNLRARALPNKAMELTVRRFGWCATSHGRRPAAKVFVTAADHRTRRGSLTGGRQLIAEPLDGVKKSDT